MRQLLFLISTTTTFAVRKSAMSERKNSTSRRSTTPAEIEAKCVRKLKEEMASSSTRGAHERKKSSTSGAPDIVNRNEITTLTTNAITWFFVVAEMQEPMER